MNSEDTAHVEILIHKEGKATQKKTKEQKGCVCKFEHPCIEWCAGHCWLFNIIIFIIGVVGIGLIAAKVLN
jgi:hypothetical protein